MSEQMSLLDKTCIHLLGQMRSPLGPFPVFPESCHTADSYSHHTDNLQRIDSNLLSYAYPTTLRGQQEVPESRSTCPSFLPNQIVRTIAADIRSRPRLLQHIPSALLFSYPALMHSRRHSFRTRL